MDRLRQLAVFLLASVSQAFPRPYSGGRGSVPIDYRREYMQHVMNWTTNLRVVMIAAKSPQETAPRVAP